MRSHRRREPLEHALVIGTAADLAGIHLALGMLSADTYGQVLVEVAPGDVLADLPTPARVTVLPIARGEQALGRAAAAWVAEWLPEEPDASRHVTIWVGASARSEVDLHCAHVGEFVQHL